MAGDALDKMGGDEGVDDRTRAEVAAVLEGVLDQLAPRTMKEKAYARARCTFVDANDARCARYGRTHSRPYLCVEHGGKRKCIEKGCDEWVVGGTHFCAAHKGVKCKFVGCEGRRTIQAGYCKMHSHEDAYEDCRRRKRDRDLRYKWLPVVMTAQGERCARSVRTCAAVHNGGSTSACPWGDRDVPRDAAQLDHITPLCEGGTDYRDNLQALCACCHALKSAAEARKRQRGANN